MPIKTTEREPVCIEELSAAVPLSEFDQWVSTLCARYQDNGRWQKYFSEKRGLSNDIQKELIPLAKFCERIAPQRPMARLRYVHGSCQSFDAEIVMPDGRGNEILEVTLACHGYQEALASEALAIHGYAPLWSTVEHSGSRANRMIPAPDLKSLNAEEIVEECITQVRDAVAKKNDSGKYENVNLVVASMTSVCFRTSIISRLLKDSSGLPLGLVPSTLLASVATSSCNMKLWHNPPGIRNNCRITGGRVKLNA